MSEQTASRLLAVVGADTAIAARKSAALPGWGLGLVKFRGFIRRAAELGRYPQF